MRQPIRLVAPLLAGALLATTVLPAGADPADTRSPAASEVVAPDGDEVREDGDVVRDLQPDNDGSLLGTPAPPLAPSAARFGAFSTATAADDGLVNGRLPERAPEPDASTARGLIPFHAIAPRLNVHADNPRVRLGVVGMSLQGRELIEVELTLPETPEQAAQQRALREQLREDPIALAADPAGFSAAYRPTLFINNNIHGNEWEGTDASLDLIDYLAEAELDAPATAGGDPAAGTVGELLSEFRVRFIVSANPDGRVGALRSNASGIDMNRDHVTHSQPETRAMRDVMVESMPLVMLDQHGYVCPTLIEPATPPHGRDMEYDLFIKWALPHAEAMEARILADPEYRRLIADSRVSNACRPVGFNTANERLRIPFRDNAEGWDDWPPIFTPMYATYHGAIAHTIEFPLNPRTGNAANNTFFAGINVRVARHTIDAMLDFAIANKPALQADQIEQFRRQAAGEPSVNGDIPDGFVPGFGPEDRWPAEFPEAYVLPKGEGQASDSAALRLGQHLLDSGIRVDRLTAPATIGGRTYAAGSLVVDMRQPRRGLASAMLSDGEDVSPRVSRMYDISGWSHARTWGATVVSVEDRAGLDDRVATTYRWRDELPTDGTVEVPAPGTEVDAAYALQIDSTESVRAVLALQRAGHVTQRAPDSTVLISPFVEGSTTTTHVPELADRYGLTFTLVDELPEGRTELPTPRFAVSVFGDEDDAFEELGLTVASYTSSDAADANVVFVNNTALGQWASNTPGGFSMDGFHGLHISNTTTTAAIRTRIASYLDAGGGLSLQAASRSLAVTNLGRFPGSTVQDHPSDANGVAKLVPSAEGNRVIFDTGVDDHGFMNYPASFSQINLSQPGLHVEQRFAQDGTDRVLLNGFWPLASQAAVTGRPVVVSLDEPQGGRISINLTEPLYRVHPRGQFRHVMNTLWWIADYDLTEVDIRATLEGEPLPATIADVRDAVQRFAAAGDIDAGRARTLVATLDRAETFVERGNVGGARGQLQAALAQLQNDRLATPAAAAEVRRLIEEVLTQL